MDNAERRLVPQIFQKTRCIQRTALVEINNNRPVGVWWMYSNKMDNAERRLVPQIFQKTRCIQRTALVEINNNRPVGVWWMYSNKLDNAERRLIPRIFQRTRRIQRTALVEINTIREQIIDKLTIEYSRVYTLRRMLAENCFVSNLS
ncbi:hypothetical protein AVEN_151514-1 [Araneus ventricosus]|uniref:Uncharacterized protein n=1 Tax=Araneus ventricosus TaxID=182803 RepID=A0A4Y2ITN9_ARAVE|nr:hypothetical protein AVEN_151514-1 [Araneus ventricosus]